MPFLLFGEDAFFGVGRADAFLPLGRAVFGFEGVFTTDALVVVDFLLLSRDDDDTRTSFLPGEEDAFVNALGIGVKLPESPYWS